MARWCGAVVLDVQLLWNPARERSSWNEPRTVRNRPRSVGIASPFPTGELSFMASYSSNSDRDKVLQATDLVALIGEHVQLKAKGREHIGLCPFHDDRSPSLCVVTHKGNAFYNCFSCGAAGNAIDFMVNYHKLDFLGALRALAERAGIQLQQTRPQDEGPANARTELLRANAIALDFYLRTFANPELGAAARAAVHSRGISQEMCERFQVGAAPGGWDSFVHAVERLREHRSGGSANSGPGARRGTGRSTSSDSHSVPEMAAFRAAGLIREGNQGPIDGFRNRLIFPICDELGKPIAFGARQLSAEDQPKYLNSPESAVFHKGKGLYGLHLAKKSIIAQRTAIICEGYTDVIACHAAGVDNVVATLGTALTRDHARILQRMCERVILLFDGDAAGQKAADRAVEVLFAETIDVRICTLPDELDPDELLRQPDGRVQFIQAVEASESALKYFVRRFRVSLESATGLSGRQQRVQQMLQRLVELGYRAMPGVRKQAILPALAMSTGIPHLELERALESVRTPAVRTLAPVAPGEGVVTVTDAAAAERVSLEDRGYNPAQVRCRREAERSVLALLAAHPELAAGRLTLEDGCTLPVAEALTPEAFEDPDLHTVAQAMHPWLEEQREFSAIELLAEIHAPTLKMLVTDLISLGAARAPEGKGASERLAEAFADLERERSRRAHTVAGALPTDQGPNGLLAAVQNSRSRGHNPAAFTRLLRPSSNQPA